jgi:hypothetical protein
MLCMSCAGSSFTTWQSARACSSSTGDTVDREETATDGIAPGC